MYKTTKDLHKAKLKVNKGEGDENQLCLPEIVIGINQGAAPSPHVGFDPWLKPGPP